MYILTQYMWNIKKEVIIVVITGIIAEFNPFHNGHKYLIEQAKKQTNADAIICIISGDYTQAGNFAVEDKFKRASRVIQNGADAVIELPVIYAVSSAEYFSSGAIDILEKLKSIDYLCFGSETADTEELEIIVQKLTENDEEIWKEISKELKNGISFAKARELAISKFLTEKETAISTLPNNILAIEYIKELRKLNSNIKPIAIKREETGNIVSATTIRQLQKEEKEYSMYLPDYTIDCDQMKMEDTFNTIVKYTVRQKGIDYLKDINEVTEGLENKIYEEYNLKIGTKTYFETLQNIKSKRYQFSKIKRIFLNILLDIKKDDFDALNHNFGYAHVLALNPENKGIILSELNKNSTIPVITSLSDKMIQELDDNNKKAIKLDLSAHNIYSIANDKSTISDYNNKL